MRKIIKSVLALVGTFVLGIGGLVAWAFTTEHTPAPTQEMATECPGAPTTLQAGQRITVLSWNLQYGASRKHQFFYDGGETVHVPEGDVRETIAAIQAVIAEVRPDLALLQEIDRDSKRTHRIDQLPPLVEAMGAGCHVAASYHQVPFVPKPLTNPLGRVDMNLGLLSRSAMGGAVRTQLALLDEPRVVQIFNLKRALLSASLPVSGLDAELAIATTHLSAFSFGDGTLGKQVGQVKAWMESRPEGQPWILSGDFNLLPPGDDPGRLEAERELYADSANPMEALVPAFQEVSPDPLAPEARTYLPFGAAQPDRKIDYMFYGGPLRLVEAKVLSQHKDISDHLPMVAVFEVVDPTAPVDVQTGEETGAIGSDDDAAAPEGSGEGSD